MRRAWVATAKVAHNAKVAHSASDPKLRIVTYNILADTLCMTEKHSYKQKHKVLRYRTEHMQQIAQYTTL